MRSESQAYIRLYNENRVKDEILRSLTRAYRDIVCFCAEHPEAEINDDPSTNLAASCVEAFFLHRIKGRGARRIASFITGSDQSPLPNGSPDCDVNFWQFIRAYIPQKLQLQLLQRPQHQRSEIGCCRAWVRACLNEGTTSSYLASIVQDRDRLCRYYYANALILDLERRTVFLELVKSLDEAEFMLNLRSSLLNYWASSAAPQLLLPHDSQQQLAGPDRGIVHPGLNALLQQRQRSVSSPVAERSPAEAAAADAAFQLAEASILNGAVADIRQQLDEIRRRQATSGIRQQHFNRSQHRQQQQQQQQQQHLDDTLVEDELESAADAAAAAAATAAIVGNSLRARVRCEASWSAPPCGLDSVDASQQPQLLHDVAPTLATSTSAAAVVANVTAAAEYTSAQPGIRQQRQQRQQHHTSWAGVWSSSVDAAVAANAAAAASATAGAEASLPVVDDENFADNVTSGVRHSASAPLIGSPASADPATVAAAPLSSVNISEHQAGRLEAESADNNPPAGWAGSEKGSDSGRASRCSAGQRRDSESAVGAGRASSSRESDAQSDSLDWVMLGDELLIKNDEGYQDLLDLFPGVSQPAFVSSVSCPVCLCRLDCSFGLIQAPQQTDQQQQQQQQQQYIRSPVTDRYDGRLYCPDCCPLKSPCPRDILNNWDFTPYPVSVRSFTVLDLIWQHPMIDLSKSNPHLYSLQPQLAEVLNLRRQALVLWRYLSACQTNRDISDQFRSCLAGLDYMYDSRLTLHLYSAADLCAVHSGDLRLRLAKAVQLARGHVNSCANCRTISARCWVCRREDRPILLHELDQYAECVSLNCASVRHTDCGPGGGARCPRCDTLQRLALDSLRFDLPDD